MKKLTVWAALMLLVSLSTVFAVRIYQRNLSQLTAQNIEALSDGESDGGPYGDKNWFEEQWDRYFSGEYSNYMGEPYTCPTKWYAKLTAKVTALLKGVPVEAEGTTEAQMETVKKGVQCTKYDKSSRCLKQDC